MGGRVFEYAILMIMVGTVLLLGSAFINAASASLERSANMIEESTHVPNP